MTDAQAQIHTVFGAGQVGRRLTQRLVDLGHEVRLVRRSEPGPARPGLTWLQGDLTDPAFADRACRGADVVYNCVNPAQYHRWDELLPPLSRAVRGAATRAAARLVVLDNLYMYGQTPDGVMREDSPQRPCSRKGELRKQLADELFEAHARGEVRVSAGRASDYFGPGGESAAVFMPRTLDRLREGKAVELLGDPDVRHSYSYIPDVARGLAVLGTDPRADGRVWHLPTTWHGTTRELLERFAVHHGQALRMRRIPNWVLSAAGLVFPLARAVAEMTYQWERDFVIDDSAFRDTFGLDPTPVEIAVEATATWARTRNEQVPAAQAA